MSDLLMTAELTGALLDAAVALAEGRPGQITFGSRSECRIVTDILDVELGSYVWAPSAWWEQGGPIIERERIYLEPCASAAGATEGEDSWHADNDDGLRPMFGPTPLIAAMRAFVAAKLGDEVELP